MLITFENNIEIDKIQCSDSRFVGFNYNYLEKQIYLQCKNYVKYKLQKFVFNNVILFDMQSCEFWGGGNSIYCIAKGDETKIEELIKKKNSSIKLSNSLYSKDNIRYIVIDIQLNSGDVFSITCESLSFFEESMFE